MLLMNINKSSAFVDLILKSQKKTGVVIVGCIGFHPIAMMLGGWVDYDDPDVIFFDSIVGKLLFTCFSGKTAVRTPGPDIFESALRRKGMRHFFVGSSRKVVDCCGALVAEAGGEWSQFEIGFGAHGGDLVTVELCDSINEFRPDFVWVLLGCPKQDQFISEIRGRISSGCVVPVGAAGKFVAGEVIRAPSVFVKGGLEWVWRIFTEPLLISERMARSTWICFSSFSRLRTLIRRFENADRLDPSKCL